MTKKGDMDIVPKNKKILRHLTNKWSPEVILCLKNDTKSFASIKRSIPSISQRMLTYTLRDMESIGLLSRHVIATYPPSVEYKLTDLGIEFREKVISLNAWAKEIDGSKKVT